MGKKYIIELKDNNLAYTAIMIDGVPYIKPLQLLPYTEFDLEQVRKEAYENGYDDAAEEKYTDGLADAWEAARKIANMPYNEEEKAFGSGGWAFIEKHTASEAIEKIRQYEQKQEEEKKESIIVEDIMRQYLNTFCNGRSCVSCLLNTPDFTCGRGYHFTSTNPISDEEVRRAYIKVRQKMEED